MRLPFTASALALVLFFVAGCCEDVEGLTVLGSVSIDIEDAQTGFSFPDETTLADDELADFGGPMAGHCTIDPAGPGSGVVDVAIVRPSQDDEGSRAIQSFSATLSDANGETSGRVAASLGETVYEAEGGADCALTLIYVDTDTGQVGFEAACTLSSSNGETAEAGVSLHFRRCQILEAEAD